MSKEDLHRRKMRTRMVVVGFFLFVGLVVLLESPLTRVRRFTVTGNTSIPAGNVLKESKLHAGMSLWQVNAKAVSRAVKKSEPLVQSVSVKTDFVNGRVTLQVAEKHVVALYEVGGKFYRLLDDGTLFGQVSPTGGFLWPIVLPAHAGGTVHTGQVPSAVVATLSGQLAQSSAAFLSTVSEIQLDVYGNATLYLDNGFAGRCKVSSLAEDASILQTAVQYFSTKHDAPGLIDLSGGPPYEYTPFPKKAAAGGANATSSAGASSKG